MFALQMMAAALLFLVSAAILRFLWLTEQAAALDERAASVDVEKRKPMALDRAA